MTPRVESYEQAIEFLFCRVNYERLTGAQYTAADFKLDRMRELLRRLGDPQQAIPAVHVAGTKGKGSTAAFVAAILTASGYRTGLFTSPHISAFEERMAVDGALPTQARLVELVNAVADVTAALDKTPGRMSPTYFEIATAMAWLYFRQEAVDVAVLEVGMGGRLDATNVCAPAVCAITAISRDHTRQLGSRVAEIAREKAGIIKPHVPVVSGALDPAARDVIERVCLEQCAPLVEFGRDFDCRYIPPATGGASSAAVDVRTTRTMRAGLPLPLVGEHQARNAAVAVAAIELLQHAGWSIPEQAIEAGLANVRWPGRIEVLRREPTVIVDAAHNFVAIEALLRTLDESFPAARRVLIFAATRDKDVAGMLRLLLPRFDSVILTSFQNNPRGVPVEELVGTARSLGEDALHMTADPAAAWKLAQRIARRNDLICITGSFFIAAELRELIVDSKMTNVEIRVTNQ